MDVALLQAPLALRLVLERILGKNPNKIFQADFMHDLPSQFRVLPTDIALEKSVDLLQWYVRRFRYKEARPEARPKAGHSEDKES